MISCVILQEWKINGACETIRLQSATSVSLAQPEQRRCPIQVKTTQEVLRLLRRSREEGWDRTVGGLKSPKMEQRRNSIAIAPHHVPQTAIHPVLFGWKYGRGFGSSRGVGFCVQCGDRRVAGSQDGLFRWFPGRRRFLQPLRTPKNHVESRVDLAC